MTANRCPIPTCRRPIATDKFMCGEHRRMIPPLVMQAIRHSEAEMRLDEGTDVERAARRQTHRQALAFGFAEVCVRLGIDIDALFKKPDPGPQLEPVRRAILDVLNGV